MKDDEMTCKMVPKDAKLAEKDKTGSKHGEGAIPTDDDTPTTLMHEHVAEPLVSSQKDTSKDGSSETGSVICPNCNEKVLPVEDDIGYSQCCPQCPKCRMVFLNDFDFNAPPKPSQERTPAIICGECKKNAKELCEHIRKIIKSAEPENGDKVPETSSGLKRNLEPKLVKVEFFPIIHREKPILEVRYYDNGFQQVEMIDSVAGRIREKVAEDGILGVKLSRSRNREGEK